MFATTEQQINGVIDKWLWSPNETQHDAAECNSELWWDCFYLGASSSPPWPGNHSTACGRIAVRACGSWWISITALLFFLSIFVLFSLCSFVFFTCLLVCKRPTCAPCSSLSLTSFWYLVTHWDKSYLQSRGPAVNLYKLTKLLVLARRLVFSEWHKI